MTAAFQSRAAGATPAMPLSMCRAGDDVELAEVRGGEGVRRHLADMGLAPGSRFTVETGHRAGPAVVRVLGSRLVLGRGMVERMRVRAQSGGMREHAGS